MREHLRHLGRRPGWTEQITLDLGAAFGPELFELRLGLDPSAVVEMPRLLPSPATARTIAAQSERRDSSRTNDWSILILSNGKLRK